MAGKGRFRLGQQLKREGDELEGKAGKHSLWANIGMGVGGLIAIGLTGGAAAPLVAAGMAAGGTYLGGKLGKHIASKKFGKLTGGRFFSKERSILSFATLIFIRFIMSILIKSYFIIKKKIIFF